MPILNYNFTYVHLQKFLEKFHEPKRMQVFKLKLQYQKELSNFFKKESVIPYDVHMMSNTTK